MYLSARSQVYQQPKITKAKRRSLTERLDHHLQGTAVMMGAVVASQTLRVCRDHPERIWTMLRASR